MQKTYIGYIRGVEQNFFHIATRADMGLPSKWSQIMFWIFSTSSLVSPAPALQSSKSTKFKEIPTLPKYGGCGSQTFWEKFPYNELPTKPETRVDHEKLGMFVKEKIPLLLKSEVYYYSNFLFDFKNMRIQYYDTILRYN
jgi:hypothetical protein